jgi:hypothetical protein
MLGLSICVNVSNETLRAIGLVLAFDVSVFVFRVWRYGHP